MAEGESGSDDQIEFTVGTSDSRSLAQGVMLLRAHLPEEEDMDSHGSFEVPLKLCAVHVPAYVTSADLCRFFSPRQSDIRWIRLLRDATEQNNYHVLLRFTSNEKAVAFAHEYDGRILSSLGDQCCRLRMVTNIRLRHGKDIVGGLIDGPDADEIVEDKPPPLKSAADAVSSASALLVGGAPSSSFGAAPSGVMPSGAASKQEDPDKCPICLEPLQALARVITACDHAMHVQCLMQWSDHSCPVCRFVLEPGPSSTICVECGTTVSLWMCIICGNVGCGRSVHRHALAHFERTSHTFSMEIDGGRVWDYAGDDFVHRLIASKTDGKPVEISSGDDWTENFTEAEGNYRRQVQEVIEHYNNRVTGELDEQRSKYLGQLQELKHRCARRAAKLWECVSHERMLVEEAEQRAEEAEQDLARQRKALEELLREAEQCRKCTKSLSAAHEEQEKIQLHSRSASEEKERVIATLRGERHRLEEQVRDLRVHVHAQSDMNATGSRDADPSNTGTPMCEELAGAAILGVAPSTSRDGRRSGRRRRS